MGKGRLTGTEAVMKSGREQQPSGRSLPFPVSFRDDPSVARDARGSLFFSHRILVIRCIPECHRFVSDPSNERMSTCKA